jgi:hypothetical protein
MARNAGGRKALVVGALLGLFASPAQGFPGDPRSGIHLMVVQDTVSEKLVCRVTQTLPPSGKGEIVVRIKVPHGDSLKSALLTTSSGDLALNVMDAASLIGEYATIIDSAKAHCAASGNLVLEMAGEFEASTIGCPEISLFDASACDESPSGER